MHPMLERFLTYVEKPLTQTGFGMVLVIVATIVPSKLAMVVAGFVFLYSPHREGWFKGKKWHIATFRIVAVTAVIGMILAAVWMAAWRFRGGHAALATDGGALQK